MGKCVRCSKIFHPMFLKQMMTHPDDSNAHQCVFCEQDKDYITNSKGEKYTKEQAIKDYEIMLKRLAEKKNIAELLVKGKGTDLKLK